MSAWPRTGTIGSFRASGRPFYCQDANTPGGFYRFADFNDEAPFGPYRSAEEAQIVLSEADALEALFS